MPTSHRQNRTKARTDDVLTIAMCPDCGAFQISLPIEGFKRVTVKIDISDMVTLIGQLVEQIELFSRGTKSKIDPNVFLPMPCCRTSH